MISMNYMQLQSAYCHIFRYNNQRLTQLFYSTDVTFVNFCCLHGMASFFCDVYILFNISCKSWCPIKICVTKQVSNCFPYALFLITDADKSLLTKKSLEFLHLKSQKYCYMLWSDISEFTGVHYDFVPFVNIDLQCIYYTICKLLYIFILVD